MCPAWLLVVGKCVSHKAFKSQGMQGCELTSYLVFASLVKRGEEGVKNGLGYLTEYLLQEFLFYAFLLRRVFIRFLENF